MIRLAVTSVAAAAGKLLRLTATGRPGETFTEREAMQHYGFASAPKAGAEAVAVVQGNRVIVVADDDRRYRIDLSEGEVALYTDEGDSITMKRGNKIEINSGGDVSIISTGGGVIEISGASELKLGGDLTALLRLIDERVKTQFDAHIHKDVTAGNDTSGPPATALDLNSCTTEVVKAE